jgi:hypothetical protein
MHHGGSIIDDVGKKTMLHFSRSAHLDNAAWEIKEGKMVKFKKGDRVRALCDNLPYARKGDTGTVDDDNSSCPWILWDVPRHNDDLRWSMNEEELTLIKGGKKMKEKKYPKGKKVYVQFNCPENDDDFSMEASFDPKELDEDYPFAECTIGDLKEIETIKRIRRVKNG